MGGKSALFQLKIMITKVGVLRNSPFSPRPFRRLLMANKLTKFFPLHFEFPERVFADEKMGLKSLGISRMKVLNVMEAEGGRFNA